MKLLLFFMMVTQLMNTTDQPVPELLEYSRNKQIPAILEKNVLKALSFYPQLKNTSISFILKKNIKNSVMQAQPVFRSLLKKRAKRSYRINVSMLFKLTHSAISIQQLPDDVMIGWLGHELGHIMDYENRSNSGLVSFGYNYYFSGSYVKNAETVADTYAVNQGLGNYLVTTKRFILDHAELPQAYKNKIARLYLSPDDIVEQVRKLEESKLARDMQDL